MSYKTANSSRSISYLWPRLRWLFQRSQMCSHAPAAAAIRPVEPRKIISVSYKRQRPAKCTHFPSPSTRKMAPSLLLLQMFAPRNQVFVCACMVMNCIQDEPSIKWPRKALHRHLGPQLFQLCLFVVLHGLLLLRNGCWLLAFCRLD